MKLNHWTFSEQKIHSTFLLFVGDILAFCLMNPVKYVKSNVSLSYIYLFIQLNLSFIEHPSDVHDFL